MTFEIGVAEKESSANLPFVEIGRRGNVRADGDLNKRRIYDLSELFCAPQVRYTFKDSVPRNLKSPLFFVLSITWTPCHAVATKNPPRILSFNFLMMHGDDDDY